MCESLFRLLRLPRGVDPKRVITIVSVLYSGMRSAKPNKDRKLSVVVIRGFRAENHYPDLGLDKHMTIIVQNGIVSCQNDTDR